MLNISSICQIARAGGAEVGEQIVFEARPAKTMPVPDNLHPLVKSRISAEHPAGLYSHQAIGIGKALDGLSICVATPTASGKTLVFTSVAVTTLLEEPESVLLALYPAKALLHDQERKWLAATKDSGLSVGIIDGGVEMSLRAEILKTNRIVLMTPDVLHAWLMARLNDPVIQRFTAALRLIVLDEAHIYDGVFGTNMAYLMRRLQAVSPVRQFLASSATIGDPLGFLEQLTGRSFELIGAADDGAVAAEKAVVVCRTPKRRIGALLKALIEQCDSHLQCRFLIFADSRKRVEELAAQTFGLPGDTDTPMSVETDERLTEIEEIAATIAQHRVLPYRAGYEEDDRDAIQQALTNGTLLGVVSTSALELGIDIGDIELVVMLGTPPSIKAFWQRAGRAGRHGPGFVLLLDVDGRVTDLGLSRYLQREPEPNWLYLDNEYLEYANALCAAEEQMQTGDTYSRAQFDTLPPTFVDLIENEIAPTRPIPDDLYPLKQQAIDGPHRAFPVRSGIEKSYQVMTRGASAHKLGFLSYSQLLREGFPGAIYRYLAKPYRVHQIKHATGEVICTRMSIGYARTNPIVQTAVFPRLLEHLYYLRKSSEAFVAECRLQVSERVVGFVEQFGQTKHEHLYGVGSSHSQKPLNRYIDTTGVCFYFPDEELQREKLGKYIALAFCRVCSVQERDVGWGTFIAQASPLGPEPLRGFGVFDSVYGSLRLTRQIPLRLDEILVEAARIATEEKAPKIATAANLLRSSVLMLGPPMAASATSDILNAPLQEEWKVVVAPNQMAICHDGRCHINEEVTVLRYIYTPQGIRYTLKPPINGTEWQVSAAMIHPISGLTKMEEYNVNTGETRPLPSQRGSEPKAA